MDGKRQALIIANDEYEDARFKRLRSPAADAGALVGVLSDPKIGGFDVQVVRNESAHGIRRRIEDLFSEARRDDLLLVHFSCHGIKHQSGELFFVARDTVPNRLISTGVSAGFLSQCLRDSRARIVVLLLDCCYGGAFAKGVRVRAAEDMDVLEPFHVKRHGGRGHAVITASSAMEYALDGDELVDESSAAPSVFTSAVVDGLTTGDADRDGDGQVSLSELYDYVRDRVSERNPNQTPTCDFELQGEVHIARNPQRVVKPRPIPPDLANAMHDPNPLTRMGAVTRLRALLASGDLGDALGAHKALAEMAKNDRRDIADEAEQAVRKVEINPAVPGIGFGVVRQHESRPSQTVPLLGPPIAHYCTVESAPRWLRAVVSEEGVDISLDTSHPGSLHGEVTVKGPTGQAVIQVAAEVIVGKQPRDKSGRGQHPEAVGALIWAVVSLPLSLVVGVGMIPAVIALMRARSCGAAIRATGGQYSGERLRMTAIVLAWATIAFSLFILVGLTLP
ncbi:caspase family protein [Streptomyces sp. KR80]|uniref:caspase family protein n=1 Tax=Streptomyces sp. KR80 TaxID=3457426 RepID=UPI003FCF24A5